MPALLPDNVDIFKVFIYVKNQHIMSMGGPIDIDVKSIEVVMDMLETKQEDRERIFKGVYGLYHYALSLITDEAEAEGKP